MIKATELMIGDWVLVSGTPRRVESITKKKIGYHINPHTDNRLYYAMLHDLEPIQVTHSLLQNVFEQGKDPNHFEKQVFVHNITLSLHRDLVCFIKVEEALFGDEVYMDFWVNDKLHLVQNALRVFDIEIDWKL
jgi:hypothetical protein